MPDVSSDDSGLEGDSEPQLKYCNLEADALAILEGDEATRFAASEKGHALGCRSGAMHIVDFEGHQVRYLRALQLYRCLRCSHGQRIM